MGNRLLPVAALTLLIADQSVTGYGGCISYYFTEKELNRLEKHMELLQASPIARARLAAQKEGMQALTVKVTGETAKAWQKRFSEAVERPDALQLGCALAMDSRIFVCFFKGLSRSGKESFPGEKSCLWDFLAIRACWPSEIRKVAEDLWGSWRKFNKELLRTRGLSANRWVGSIKLLRAVDLLAETHLQVAKVGSLCGFSNHAYFSAKFKKKFSHSPRSWRNLAISREGWGDTMDHLKEMSYGCFAHSEPNDTSDGNLIEGAAQ